MEELKKRGTVSNLSPNIKEKHLKYGDKIEGVSICYPLIKTAGGRQKVAVVNENIWLRNKEHSKLHSGESR